jgi:DNA-binding NarL/FixJ family response regulator
MVFTHIAPVLIKRQLSKHSTVSRGRDMAARRSANRIPEALLNGETRPQLTARERDVVRLVSNGLSNKVVARHLGLREGTIKIHLHNVYRKLRIANRMTLIVQESAARGDDI